MNLAPQVHVDSTAMLRDPSVAPYIAASTTGRPSVVDVDDDDEVLSTDTAEALREAAKKRADTCEEEDLERGKTPPSPMGIMAIHLLQLKEFDQTAIDLDLVDPRTRFKMLISIGDIYKETRLKKGNLKHVREKDKTSKVLARVAVDEVKHFSMRIPQQISDLKNVLKLELYGTSVNNDASAPPQLVGMVEVHLHEIMKAVMLIDVLPLSLDNRQVANIYLEFAFMYGSMGFLYSTQLENPGFNPSRDLSRTMFPRVSLPVDRDGEVLQPIPQHPPAFVPWTCPVITHWDEVIRRAPAGTPPSAPAAFADTVQSEVRNILADYLPISSRGDRLAFLQRLIRGTPGLNQRADAAEVELDSRPSSGRSDRSDRTAPDQTRTTQPGPGPPPDRDARQTPAAPGQTAQLRQSGGPAAAPAVAAVVSGAVAAAAAGAGAAAAAGSGTASTASSSHRSAQHTAGRQHRPPPSRSTDTEPAARGPQLSSSNTTKLAAPKHIRRVPWKRPVSATSSTETKPEDGADSTIDSSVEIV